MPLRRVALSASVVAGIAGCVVATATIRPLVVDQHVLIQGRVSSVDTSPMAYDGDALVLVTSALHGVVTVHLPARRHLCKAQGLDLLEALKPGDRLQVEGLATGAAAITVCAASAHRLQRVP